jgi:hypothetical protein
MDGSEARGTSRRNVMMAGAAALTVAAAAPNLAVSQAELLNACKQENSL